MTFINKQTIRFIDLFAGSGGMRLGLEHACGEIGLQTECVFASEINKHSCQIYEKNFGHNPYKDICETHELPEYDFMLAGFPCQTFSYAGKREGFGETRGTLFFEVERLLKKHKPRGFLLENVRGLVSHDGGRTLKTILNALSQLGYSVKYVLLNSHNFGVPQNRVRIYILGVLDAEITLQTQSDVGAADSHSYKNEEQSQLQLFPSQANERVVLRDILEDNPDEKYFCSEIFASQLKKQVGNDLTKLFGYRLIDTRGGNSIHSWDLGIKGTCTPQEKTFMNLLIQNRRLKKFGTHQDGKALSQDQIATFYPNQDFVEVTQSLISKGYLREIDGKYNPVCGNMSFEVFKFLDPNSICITLTASDSNRIGVITNNRPRKLTTRECARLQGFPDSYKLLVDDKYNYKIMGNAVTVPVIKHLCKDLLNNFITKSPK